MMGSGGSKRLLRELLRGGRPSPVSGGAVAFDVHVRGIARPPITCWPLPTACCSCKTASQLLYISADDFFDAVSESDAAREMFVQRAHSKLARLRALSVSPCTIASVAHVSDRWLSSGGRQPISGQRQRTNGHDPLLLLLLLGRSRTGSGLPTWLKSKPLCPAWRPTLSRHVACALRIVGRRCLTGDVAGPVVADEFHINARPNIIKLLVCVFKSGFVARAGTSGRT